MRTAQVKDLVLSATRSKRREESGIAEDVRSARATCVAPASLELQTTPGAALTRTKSKKERPAATGDDGKGPVSLASLPGRDLHDREQLRRPGWTKRSLGREVGSFGRELPPAEVEGRTYPEVFVSEPVHIWLFPNTLFRASPDLIRGSNPLSSRKVGVWGV